MKITSFQLTIQQGVYEQGYVDNFYICINEEGSASISRPYKSIPIEEQLAIEEVITATIKAYLKLVKQVDNANKDLRLEEYRLIESVVEPTSATVSVETLKLAQAELAGRPEGSNAQTESYVVVGEDAYKALEEDSAKESLAQLKEALKGESVVSQSCALGGGEVSTGAEVEIRDVPFEEVETGSDKA